MKVLDTCLQRQFCSQKCLYANSDVLDFIGKVSLTIRLASVIDVCVQVLSDLDGMGELSAAGQLLVSLLHHCSRSSLEHI